MKLHKYKVFGLIIDSELEIPELVPEAQATPNVLIRFGKVPDGLDIVHGKGVLFEANNTDFIFRLRSIGAYRVQNGNTITIDPAPNSTRKEVRLFLLGSCMGALLIQRGLIPFHGSGILNNGKATILSGNSAAGKSSLAAGLFHRGYQIITDDISAVGVGQSETLLYPGIPHLKLWKDVLDHFGMDKSTLEKVRPQLEKYRFPLSDPGLLQPVILENIVIINSKNSEGIHSEQIVGTEKFELLSSAIYRTQYIEGLGRSLDYFHKISIIANAINVYKVERPVAPLLIDELSDYISKTILS